MITTATCIALQGKDDCEELNTLRDFRDEHINNTDEGQRLVLEYYRVAPLIIEQIDLEDDPIAIYHKLWNDYIKPSCCEIKNNNYNLAKDIYIEMVLHLCRKYKIELTPNIAMNYGIM